MTEQLRLGFNARRILSTLRSRGPRSRADLARMLDITPSTVTRLTGHLMAEGLLSEEEDPSREGQKGFPAKLLRIEPQGLCTAGVYLDPDRIMTCIADLSGELLGHEEVAVPDRSFAAIMGEAGESVRRLIARAGIDPDRVGGCGVSYPGQYSEDPTQVMRIRQFRDWPKVNVARDLRPYFGMPVHHMNDAKAACLAELYHGAAREVRNFCHIWLSYGIGGAAVIDQRPYLGRKNGAAEWGGLFPKSRPRPSGQDLLDTLAASGVALDRLSDIDDSHLALPVVADWRERAAEQLRWLCLVIARTYAPDAIVIGGTLHPDLIQGFIDAISGAPQLGEDFHVAPPRILRAARDNLPQLGAAALPIHDVLSPATYRGQARKGWAPMADVVEG
jgi:predicted NBD/HSP70 family sugar kinase